MRYPRFESSQKALKVVNKAKARLCSSKKMISGERRKANAVIDKASTKQCPFKKQFAHCKAKDCRSIIKIKKHTVRKTSEKVKKYQQR